MNNYFKQVSTFILLILAVTSLWYAARPFLGQKSENSLAYVNSVFANKISIFEENTSTLSVEYGNIISSGINLYNGLNVFEGLPDIWHQPTIILSGQDVWRADISSYDEIRFYAKSDTPDMTFNFSLSGWPDTTNQVNIDKFIDHSDGKNLTTSYKLIRIPISVFGGNSALNKIERLYFGSSNNKNYKLYIAQISVIKNQIITPPVNPPKTNPIVIPPSHLEPVTIFDGDAGSAPLLNSSCLEFATLTSVPNTNLNAIKLNGNEFQTSAFRVFCASKPRADWSGYETLQFYIRATSGNQLSRQFWLSSYVTGDIQYSRKVNISKYVVQNLIDQKWRLVKIPLSDLRTTEWNLNGVEMLYYDLNTASNVYIDNIVLGYSDTFDPIPPSFPETEPPVVNPPIKPPVIVNPPVVNPPVITPPIIDPIKTPTSTVPIISPVSTTTIIKVDQNNGSVSLIGIDFISSNVLRLHFNARYDMNQAYNAINYTLTSSQDKNFYYGAYPVQTGRQFYVEYFNGSGIGDPNDPKIDFEVYLRFGNALIDSDKYTLKINNFGSTSGTNISQATFIFSDDTVNGTVKASQVGYLPISPKFAYIGNYMGDAGVMPVGVTKCDIIDSFTGFTVKTYTAVLRGDDPLWSGEKVYSCDFSSLTNVGTYFIRVPGYGRTYDFKIGNDIYDNLYKTVAKALYYQRAGLDLLPTYAGKWSRAAGHVLTDKQAVIMPNQNHSPLYAGESGTVDMSHGWYDAGDYGKYTASASLALNEILTAYDLFPQKFVDGDLNIPESGNGIPDILDEAKWELDWLRNMQSDKDGGVYHYVATEHWASGMPLFDTSTRYITEKSTHATAEYAAILAHAYNVFKKFPVLQSYANDLLVRAKKAWTFLDTHTTTYSFSSYGFAVNPPGIGGGENSDSDTAADEKAWAAAELYRATGEQKYNDAFIYNTYNMPGTNGGRANGPLGGESVYGTDASQRASLDYALIKGLPQNQSFLADYKQQLAGDAARIVSNIYSNPYRNADQGNVRVWVNYGSFSQSSRNSWTLIKDYFILNDSKLLEAAKLNFDAQLGVNPLYTTYITGIGEVSPRRPVHTISTFDGIDDPVPGIPVYGVGRASNGYDWGRAVQDNNNMYPAAKNADDPYPTLRRYFDTSATPETSEFTIVDIAYTAIAYAFFSEK